ncbi:MAG: hypothetical protein ACLTQL_04255 [Eisenbergiella sp.]
MGKPHKKPMRIQYRQESDSRKTGRSRGAKKEAMLSESPQTDKQPRKDHERQKRRDHF